MWGADGHGPLVSLDSDRAFAGQEVLKRTAKHTYMCRRNAWTPALRRATSERILCWGTKQACTSRGDQGLADPENNTPESRRPTPPLSQLMSTHSLS